MNERNLEASLARWRPATPPPDLMRRLRAAAPPAQVDRFSWRPTRGWFYGWRPWPLAYAGLLAAWALIVALRLTTPADPSFATPVVTVQTDAASVDACALRGNLGAERGFLLGRNNLD